LTLILEASCRRRQAQHEAAPYIVG
jgi:hypothetical protein